MSLRVTDVQINMMKSQDVGKIQQMQQGNEAAQQQGFADSLIKKAEMQRETVQTTPETVQGKVAGDGARREREGASKKESDQQEPEKDEDKQLASPFVGTIIDCRI